MRLLLISAFVLVVSWIITISGLYFAIKYKEANNIKKSKFFYCIIVIGELFEKISWYMLLISMVLIVIKMIGY